MSCFDSILAICSDDESKARLLAANSAESGAWLNAPPVSSQGLRMSDEAIRIAVGWCTTWADSPASVPSVVQRLPKLSDMVSVAGLAKGDFHAIML